MKLDDVVVGDICRMRLGDDVRDPHDRRIWITRWVWVEVVNVSPTSGRVTVRLWNFSDVRARSVKPDRLMA